MLFNKDPTFNHDTNKHMEISAKNGTLSSIKDIIRQSCSRALITAIKYKRENVIDYLTSLGVQLSMKQFCELIKNDRLVYTHQPKDRLVTSAPFYAALKLRLDKPKLSYTEEELNVFYQVFDIIPENACLDYTVISVILKTYTDEKHIEKLLSLSTTTQELLLNCSIQNIPKLNHFRKDLLARKKFSFDEINNALLIAIENMEVVVFNELMSYLDKTFEINYGQSNTNLIHHRHFMYACQYGYLDIVKMLVEKKNTNMCYNQNAAIRLASEKGKLDVVKYLIDKGVDPKLYNNSCIKRAIINKHIDLIEYLLSIGCNPTKWITQAIYTHDIDIISLLENYGYNIIKNEFALVCAIETSNLEYIKFLVDNGADVSIRTGYPLRYSAAHKQTEIVEYLLDNGADINLALSSGKHVLADMARDFLDKYVNIFIGPLPENESCGICFNTLSHIKLYQCKVCYKLVHHKCQMQWSKGCVYCRST